MNKEKCAICGEVLHITYSHTRSHGLEYVEYRQRYGTISTRLVRQNVSVTLRGTAAYYDSLDLVGLAEQFSLGKIGEVPLYD